jgi:hypothetical protein
MADQNLFLTILIIAALVSFTVLFHYEGLRVLSAAVQKIRVNQRAQMLAIIIGVFLIHVIEIAIYGVAYWFGDAIANIGNFHGSTSLSVRDLFYFSAETYTGLGYGDISPTGDLRLMVSIETLNGLLLLGWTTSYTYIAMQKYWEEHANGTHITKAAPVPDPRALSAVGTDDRDRADIRRRRAAKIVR